MGEAIRPDEHGPKRRDEPTADAPRGEIVILPGVSLRDLVTRFGTRPPTSDDRPAQTKNPACAR